MQSKLDGISKHGIGALKKERDKTQLYVERMEIQPFVHKQGIEQYLEYLEAINEEIKKIE
jgi:hypothetical protein